MVTAGHRSQRKRGPGNTGKGPAREAGSRSREAMVVEKDKHQREVGKGRMGSAHCL